jgi:hypothetical protein
MITTSQLVQPSLLAAQFTVSTFWCPAVLSLTRAVWALHVPCQPRPGSYFDVAIAAASIAGSGHMVPRCRPLHHCDRDSPADGGSKAALPLTIFSQRPYQNSDATIGFDNFAYSIALKTWSARFWCGGLQKPLRIENRRMGCTKSSPGTQTSKLISKSRYCVRALDISAGQSNLGSNGHISF